MRRRPTDERRVWTIREDRMLVRLRVEGVERDYLGSDFVTITNSEAI